ncbi:MAG TPA: NAD(P)H-hydrate dehydratase [Desulfobacterales bacterium]|nr:NAD(P)H-hydrate dehydratase [Desulfobacterales bacterium]HIP37903.1 NAD(P)H-hydrate dehydratase [Desulfocapsa sulfexigens]
MKLPNATEMRGLDHCAINEFHIPGIVLMENAGLGTVHMMEKELGSAANSFSLIFIGPGNNGGDGLVIGRHLHQRGCRPIFFFLVDPDKLTGEAAANMAIVRKLRLPFHVIDSVARVQTLPVLYKQFLNQGRHCYAIVDAIFGTGLSRPVADQFADTINFINYSESTRGLPVIAVDIPSGMDSDNGKIHGSSIRADYTAAYGCAKPGHVLHHGPEFAGKVHIIDIGIPPEAMERARITTELLDRATAATLISSLKRVDNVHKGSHGHLAILAGSVGKTGAAILAAKSALRAGTGLVSLFSPKDLNATYESLLVEAMTIPLPASTSFLSINDFTLIDQGLVGKKAVILGPGLGTDQATADLVLKLYETIKLPIILDADALNILAKNRGTLPGAAGPRIFTPHPGEMSRLLGCSIEEIQDNRVSAAQEACRIYGKECKDCIMILKGSGTIVTSSGGLTYINTSGNPGMATGGMGDVLTGIIGGLVCQKLSCETAAAAGVFLHGMAGDSLYDEYGFGYTATELEDRLPKCIASLLKTA